MRYSLSREPLLIVVSAPSGGGKSTILDRILDRDPAIRYSVSATSRPPRPGELNGVHYDFLTVEEFQKKVAAGEFLEHAVVHNHLYGTLESRVTELIEGGWDVIMDLDFQGGLNVKRKRPDSVLIFIIPPSLAVLEQRLMARGQDSRETIALRLRNAERECDHAAEYDYIVLNDALDRTVETIHHIIDAERYRTGRLRIQKDPEPAWEG
ncbi:MAG: guanylate kinase [Candidatus Sumerlaeia bacterium]